MRTPIVWNTQYLSDVVDLQRGFDLPHHARRPGPYPVLTSGESGGFHDEGPIEGPGITIGRATNLGKPKWSETNFWPHNTTMFVKDFKGNNRRWVFHLFESLDLSGFDSGSVQPMLNRNYIAKVPVAVPPLAEQRAIAEVLGALDDKIAANSMKASTAEQLAGVLFDKVSVDLNKIPVSQVLTPILGGTPNRKNPEFWGGQVHWASAKDVTSAPHSVVADTEEKITRMATEQTKAKPLPIGGVIVTARGTVGAVARLALPTSFNQSCYGFSPSELPPGLLYFSILRAAQRAKSLSHGSVFDTITMKSFDHLFIPDFGESAEKMEHQIAPLLETVDSSIKENKTLVSMRDALLPQLMSGKLRVRDAEAVVEAVL